MKPIQRLCENCDCFAFDPAIEEKVGVCRFNPPEIRAMQKKAAYMDIHGKPHPPEVGLQVMFPQVDKKWWCKKFEVGQNAPSSTEEQ